MKTDGGGWTLVYGYSLVASTFPRITAGSFRSLINAVVPRPSWPAPRASVVVSFLPPTMELSQVRGALDWNLWKNIGKEFMVKSNINDWIVCQPNGGSLVTKTNGGISCRNIKNVATFCSGVVPYRVNWNPVGPSLDASSHYYFFDGSTKSDWPAHDPCGKGTYHQKKGVIPYGQIFLR